MIFGKTKQGYIRWYASLAFPLGLMLSPDALSLLGNKVGAAGLYFLQMLCIGAVVHSLTTLSYGRVYHSNSGARGEVTYVKQSLGGLTAFLFPICTRIAFTVCAATGILATAGYVFNEIFILWFPNLGFSFVLLALLLLIGLWGEKAVIPAQIISMSTVVLGLVLLSFLGLMQGDTVTAHGTAFENDSFNLLHLYALGLVFFVGFDLAAISAYSSNQYPGRVRSLMLWAIVIGGLLLAVWGLVSLLQVSPNRLTATSIPYSIVAREILGGPGRKIMGLMIVFASFGFANSLLAAISGILAEAIRKIGVRPNNGMPEKRTRFFSVFLILTIVLMLASGMAGEPRLEVFTRGSIYLWLLNYGIVHLAVLTRVLRNRPKSAVSALFVSVAGFLLTIGGVVSLICFDPDSLRVLQFIAVYLGTGLILSLIWIAAGKPFFTFSDGV